MRGHDASVADRERAAPRSLPAGAHWPSVRGFVTGGIYRTRPA